MSGKHDIKELQKATVLDTGPIFRKVLDEQNICC